MVLGYFGKTPVAPDSEIVKICADKLGLQPTTKTVLELNDANPALGIEAAKKRLKDGGITDFSDENIFISACCEDKGILFLQGKAKVNVAKNKNGKVYDISVTEGIDAAAAAPSAAAGDGTPVNAPMPGLVLRIPVAVGDTVEENQEVIVLEAMKMETPIYAPAAGTVKSILVSNGDQVTSGQILMEIG